MNKILTLLAAFLLLTACNSTTQSAVGEIDYFVGEAPNGVQNSALGQLCFVPSEKETTNAGEMFCFTNKDEALRLLGLENPENCDYYWHGVATVEFTDLSVTAASHAKGDACFEEGTCDFNTATFIKATTVSSGIKCENKRSDARTYTDPSGFSFEYPTGWTLESGTEVPTLLSTEGDRISFTKVSGDKVQDVDNKFGDVTYFFDEILNEWQVIWNTDSQPADQGAKTAVPSFYTETGLSVFAGIGRWKTDIVALSHDQFLLVNITGSGETADLDPLVKTIMTN